MENKFKIINDKNICEYEIEYDEKYDYFMNKIKDKYSVKKTR